MSKYQLVFLFYVFIYYFFKIGILAACYCVAKLVKKNAQQRYEQHKTSFMKKRADERERWKVAYGLYNQQKNAPTSEPFKIANPNSFAAYSNVSQEYLKWGLSV
jgi:hypothetical protein